jgi:hypothetical protein
MSAAPELPDLSLYDDFCSQLADLDERRLEMIYRLVSREYTLRSTTAPLIKLNDLVTKQLITVAFEFDYRVCTMTVSWSGHAFKFIKPRTCSDTEMKKILAKAAFDECQSLRTMYKANTKNSSITRRFERVVEMNIDVEYTVTSSTVDGNDITILFLVQGKTTECYTEKTNGSKMDAIKRLYMRAWRESKLVDRSKVSDFDRFILDRC